MPMLIASQRLKPPLLSKSTTNHPRGALAEKTLTLRSTPTYWETNPNATA